MFALKRPALRLIAGFFYLVQIRISHARLVSQVYLDAIGIVGFKLLSRLSERRRDADNQHVSGDCEYGGELVVHPPFSWRLLV